MSESTNTKRKSKGNAVQGDSGMSQGFDLFSVDELAKEQAEFIKAFVSSATSNAGLIAVGKGFYDWDVRPVIALAQEEGPSVIRLLGPDVSRNPEVLATVRHTFEALQKHGSLNADFREWGEYKGQVWFRRGLTTETLYSKLSGKIDITIEQGVSIIRSLIEEIALWHARGVIHGHVANSNIFVTPAHGVVMLDAAAGAALLCASENAKAMRYRLAAPEVIERGALSDRADLFGLGEVIRRVIVALKKEYQLNEKHQPAIEALKEFTDLSKKLTHKDPFKRIPIEEVVAIAQGIQIPFVVESLAESVAPDLDVSEPKEPAALQTPEPIPSPASDEEMAISTQEIELGAAERQAIAAAEVSAAEVSVTEKTPIDDSDPFSLDALFGDTELESSKPTPRVRVSEPTILDQEFPIPAAAVQPGSAPAPEPAAKEPVDKAVSEPAPSSGADPFSFESLLADVEASSEAAPSSAGQPPVPPAPPKELPSQPVEEFEFSMDAFLDEPAQVESAMVVDPEQAINPVFEDIAQEPETRETGGFDPFAGAFDEFEKSIEKPKKEPVAEDTFDPFAGAFMDEEVDSDEDDLLGLSSAELKVEHKGSTTSSSSSNSFPIYLLVVGCLLLGIWYFFRGVDRVETLEYSVQDIRSAWDSKIPSRMLTVAELSVDSGVDNKIVQDIIVGGAKKGQNLPSVVNTPLLRVAFHDRWEMELDTEDRRFALALGLAGLLRNKMPTDLGPLTERHPGVILAITASAGSNTRKILSKIPALSLANLPPPFGPAFQKLVEDEPDLSCASDSVHLLARFGTRGLEGVSAQEIVDYLARDTSKRLQALALIVSYEELAAKRVLDVLLNDPTVNFRSPEVLWAKTWEVDKWPNMGAADRLFSLAGVPPATRVSIDRLKTFFSHPSPGMRAYSIRQARERLAFEHPASNEILDSLEKNPELINPEQLLRLGEILQSPKNVADDRVQAWLKSEPPIEIVSTLLLSRSGAAEGDKTDTWFAYYLKNSDWQPSQQELQKLINHPDKYSRLYAYTSIQDRVVREKIDSQVALDLFRKALSQETDPEYQEQLQMMISQF